MTPQIKTIIVDSSVAIKWFLHDESNQKALEIEDAFRNKSILIAIPTLFFYEVGNILKTTTKSLRLNENQSTLAMKNFLEVDFIAYSSRELFIKALKKSIDWDISFYDASYVALADYLNIPLYTADQKLLQKAESNLVKDLKEFSFS